MHFIFMNSIWRNGNSWKQNVFPFYEILIERNVRKRLRISTKMNSFEIRDAVLSLLSLHWMSDSYIKHCQKILCSEFLCDSRVYGASWNLEMRKNCKNWKKYFNSFCSIFYKNSSILFEVILKVFSLWVIVPFYPKYKIKSFRNINISSCGGIPLKGINIIEFTFAIL